MVVIKSEREREGSIERVRGFHKLFERFGGREKI